MYTIRSRFDRCAIRFKYEQATKSAKGTVKSAFPWTKEAKRKRGCIALMKRAERKAKALLFLCDYLKLKDWESKKPMSEQKIREKLAPAIDLDTQFKQQVEYGVAKARFYKPQPRVESTVPESINLSGMRVCL